MAGLIMVGERNKDGAHLTLSVPTSVPTHLRDSLRELTQLFVPITLRNNGLATALMRDVVLEADGHGMALMLHVDPWTPDMKLVLRDFYQRFGFKVFQETPAMLMVRSARGPKADSLRQAVAKALH